MNLFEMFSKPFKYIILTNLSYRVEYLSLVNYYRIVAIYYRHCNFSIHNKKKH